MGKDKKAARLWNGRLYKNFLMKHYGETRHHD